MSENLSAKYYQENKERQQKKLVKDIKIFLKKKKKKSESMILNVNVSSEIRNKSLSSIKKIYHRMRKKCLIIIMRNYFDFENFAYL